MLVRYKKDSAAGAQRRGAQRRARGARGARACGGAQRRRRWGKQGRLKKAISESVVLQWSSFPAILGAGAAMASGKFEPKARKGLHTLQTLRFETRKPFSSTSFSAFRAAAVMISETTRCAPQTRSRGLDFQGFRLI